MMTISPSPQACSVCLCGDDLYLYGHRHQLMPGKFSLSLENRYFNKTSGPTHHHEEPVSPAASDSDEQEKLREYRPSLTLAYGVGTNLTLAASLASSVRRFEEVSSAGSEIQNISGFGDLQLQAMWNIDLFSKSNRSYILGTLLSIKAPTGSDGKTSEGQRLDDHLQCGTGSWDYKAGFGLARVTNLYSAYGSFYYQLNGTNDFQFHYGNIYLFNLGGEYRPSLDFALTGELNGRFAKRDEENNELLPNTGGWVLYLTPGFRYNLAPTLGVIANVQIPIYEDLYEDQNEGGVFTLSFRYDVL